MSLLFVVSIYSSRRNFTLILRTIIDIRVVSWYNANMTDTEKPGPEAVQVIWRCTDGSNQYDYTYTPPDGWYVDKVNTFFSPGGRRWNTFVLRPEPKLIWKADA